MSWLLYGLAAAGTVLIGAAAYYDVFRTVKFQDGVLPANKFFYVPFRGPYKEVNRIFSKVYWCMRTFTLNVTTLDSVSC